MDRKIEDMILIADSGSTKTDWGIIKQGKFTELIQTKGINPYFQTEEEISDELSTALIPRLGGQPVGTAYFYGAGCTNDKVEVVRKVIASSTQAGQVEVNTDLLAAARSICRDQAGIVCILGTGSNSCFYDGRQITEQVSPLGFILGDEGSGAVLGKLLVGNILKGMMTPALKEKFLKQFNLTPFEIIHRVYREPFPNRFLASLSPFLAENIHEPQIYDLVLESFTSFFIRNIKGYDYKNYSTHFVGSIACHYKEILLEAAEHTGIRIGSIVKSPMSGLISFHTQTNLSR